MKGIRIRALYGYYSGTLLAAVDQCYEIKTRYIAGTISYRRAWRQLDDMLRFAQSRLILCQNLAGLLGFAPGEATAVRKSTEDIDFIKDWMA